MYLAISTPLKRYANFPSIWLTIERNPPAATLVRGSIARPDPTRDGRGSRDRDSAGAGIRIVDRFGGRPEQLRVKSRGFPASMRLTRLRNWPP